MKRWVAKAVKKRPTVATAGKSAFDPFNHVLLRLANHKPRVKRRTGPQQLMHEQYNIQDSPLKAAVDFAWNKHVADAESQSIDSVSKGTPDADVPIPAAAPSTEKTPDTPAPTQSGAEPPVSPTSPTSPVSPTSPTSPVSPMSPASATSGRPQPESGPPATEASNAEPNDLDEDYEDIEDETAKKKNSPTSSAAFQAVRDRVVGEVYAAMSDSAKAGLRERAQADVDKQRADYKAAISAPPSDDPVVVAT